jgi:hypothetical protein
MYTGEQTERCALVTINEDLKKLADADIADLVRKRAINKSKTQPDHPLQEPRYTILKSFEERMTPAEVALLLMHKSIDTVYRHIKKHGLPVHYDGPFMTIDRKEYDGWWIAWEQQSERAAAERRRKREKSKSRRNPRDGGKGSKQKKK